MEEDIDLFCRQVPRIRNTSELRERGMCGHVCVCVGGGVRVLVCVYAELA